MSSFVSILNDDPIPYFCKFYDKPGRSTINWEKMSSTVLAAVTAALAVSPALTTKGTKVYDVPGKFLQPSNTGATDSKFTSVLQEHIEKYLTDNKYVLVMPRERKSSPKLGVKEKIYVDCKYVSRMPKYVSIKTMGNDVSTGVEVSLFKWDSWGFQIPDLQYSREAIQGVTNSGPKLRG